ncbi:MAG: hypothetical protein NTX05_00005 [Fusobacteria bacterium]|nr:hypothetical protein [Fusobacteriota bacterium]
MKKILLIILGMTLLSTFMFGAQLNPYQYTKNTWPKPDVYSFKGICENQSSRTIEFGAISEDPESGRVFVQPFSIPPKSTCHFSIQWQLKNNKIMDYNNFYFIIDHMSPSSHSTEDCLRLTTGKDKHNKFMYFKEGVSNYKYFSLSQRQEGQAIHVIITDKLSLN